MLMDLDWLASIFIPVDQTHGPCMLNVFVIGLVLNLLAPVTPQTESTSRTRCKTLKSSREDATDLGNGRVKERRIVKHTQGLDFCINACGHQGLDLLVWDAIV